MAEDTEGHVSMQVQKRTGKADGRNVHQEQWNKLSETVSGRLLGADCWKLIRKMGKICLKDMFWVTQKFDRFLGLLSCSSVAIFIHLCCQCLPLSLLHSYDYKHFLKFPREIIASKCLLSKLVNFIICPRSILLKLSIRPLSPKTLQFSHIENSDLRFLIQALDLRRLSLHMCSFLNTIKTKSFFNKYRKCV